MVMVPYLDASSGTFPIRSACALSPSTSTAKRQDLGSERVPGMCSVCRHCQICLFVHPSVQMRRAKDVMCCRYSRDHDIYPVDLRVSTNLPLVMACQRVTQGMRMAKCRFDGNP